MAIGVVVIGGLGFASILTLFVTPVLYHLLAHLTRPVNAIETELAASLAERQQQPAEDRPQAVSRTPRPGRATCRTRVAINAPRARHASASPHRPAERSG